MSPIILYICLGSLFPILFVVVWYRGEPRELEGVIEPSSRQSRFFDIAFLVALFVGGIGMLCIGTRGTQNFIHDHQTIPINVPLIEVNVDDTGKNNSYEAVYEYQGTRREQEITEDQYNALKNQHTVDILVDGDTSRIYRREPDYKTIVLVICIIVVPLILPFTYFRLIIEYLFQNPKPKWRKRKTFKMKKRAQEEL